MHGFGSQGETFPVFALHHVEAYWLLDTLEASADGMAVGNSAKAFFLSNWGPRPSKLTSGELSSVMLSTFYSGTFVFTPPQRFRSGPLLR